MATMALAKGYKSKRREEIGKLATSEILAGILVADHGRRIPFSEQDVYRFFAKLEAEHPSLAGRFRVRGVFPRLTSEPLRQALSFFEMAKILEIPMPNPVVQYFHARPSQLDSLRGDLRERGVLPAHESLLQRLGEEFFSSHVPRRGPGQPSTSAAVSR